MALQIRTDGLVDAERLRQTLSILRESGSKGVTKLQLARKLGSVSPRTVDRAVKLLEEQGARIGKGRSGKPSVIHFTLDKGPSWDQHVSTEARLALRLAALSLSQSGTQLWENKLQVLGELASSNMSTRDHQIFDQLQKSVRVQGGVEDPVESPEVLEPILRALESSKEVELDYQSVGSKKASTMTVMPFALTHDLFSGGAFLLVWEPKRKLPLHLRLGRIARVKVLTRTALIPEPAIMEQAAKHQIGGWTSTDEPFVVKARIEGVHWVQALKEAPPALPGFQAVLSKDGSSAEVSFRATHSAGASRWLLQFGEAAEVLEPATLRKEMGQRLAVAAAKYR
jgi:predicted DNA-binding transcriptional regulator YafY